MDGKDLRRRVQQLINEGDIGTWEDERTTYDFLYGAARQWVIETECLTAEQEITTVATQAGYTLNGDFLALYMKDDFEYFIKYYDASGESYSFPKFKDYSKIYYENNTTSIAVPNYFTLTDDNTLDSVISDAADNAADDAGGKTILTMNTEVFADVTSGDIIHNTTDASDGVITKVTSTKIIEICLFGGTDNEIDVNDAFIIQPRKRLKIILDPPPSTEGDTVYVPYLQKPDPVYSDYDVYKLPLDYPDVLCKYAAWLYKYRDDEPNYGDAFYKYWRKQIMDYRALTNKSLLREESQIVPRMR